MSRGLWILGLPALAGAGWHVLAIVRGAPAVPRLLLCALALATVVHALRGRGFVVYTVGAIAVFWSAVLEAVVTRDTLGAFGFTCLLGAAFAHGALAHSAGGTVTRRAAWQLVLGVVAFGCVQSALGFVMPAYSYSPVADPGSAPDSLYRADDGRVRGRAGFRGTYRHPEFDGVRIELNDLGLRDGLDEVTPPAADELSVLVLGDSLVWGIGVPLEETFQERLEARAAEFSDAPVRVTCAGIPGYGPRQSRAMLAELAPSLRPDIVVLSVFEDNDLQESLYSERSEVAPAADSEVGRTPDTRSPLARYLARVVQPGFWAPLATANRRGAAPLLTRAGLRDPAAQANVFVDLCLRVPTPERVVEAREAALRQVEAIDAECRALGAELIVLAAPAAHQADARRFRSFVAAQVGDGSEFSRTAFHADFVARLRELGLRVVDPLAELEAQVEAGRSSYHVEGHWNGNGHAAALEVLVPALAEAVRAR